MSTLKIGKLFVITLWAPDISEGLHFYHDVLGLDLLSHHEGQHTFTVGDGIHLAICKGAPVPAEDSVPFPVIRSR
jgi:catechol 2,3-dioxygenase-like lactoylglutathione lyase family enzyme